MFATGKSTLRGFARNIAGDSSGLLALLSVALLFLLGDSALREEPLVELGYAITLLSIFGAVVCGGNLVRNLLGSRTRFFGSHSSLNSPAQTASGFGGIVHELPVFVTLLLSSFSFLFAGLAGWVYGASTRV